jgi:hypothetical protein
MDSTICGSKRECAAHADDWTLATPVDARSSNLAAFLDDPVEVMDEYAFKLYRAAKQDVSIYKLL